MQEVSERRNEEIWWKRASVADRLNLPVRKPDAPKKIESPLKDYPSQVARHAEVVGLGLT